MRTDLVACDDHLVHTGPGVFGDRGPVSSDPRFFERYWNVWHDDTGDLVVAIGGSFYPHLGRAADGGRAEAYAIVNLRGDHRSVRAYRPLAGDRSTLTVGPLRPRIEEGLHRWRHVLDHGEWDFSYDLTFTDTHRQVYNAAWGPEVTADARRAELARGAGACHVTDGERHVTAGFEGFGETTGWIRVGNTCVEWPAGTAHGTRDRHWGVGRGVGGPTRNGGTVVRGGWKGGIWIDLGDVAVWGKQVLRRLDDPRAGAGRVIEVSRRLRFEDSTRIFTEGLIDLTLDDGTVRCLHLERLGVQTAYMRCGFYGGTPAGPDGGASKGTGGLHHGEYDGPARVEWDRFDVTDPAVRLALRGLDEHHCRVSVLPGEDPEARPERVTTGILQPLEPDAYEACVAGKPGWELW